MYFHVSILCTYVYTKGLQRVHGKGNEKVSLFWCKKTLKSVCSVFHIFIFPELFEDYMHVYVFEIECILPKAENKTRDVHSQ